MAPRFASPSFDIWPDVDFGSGLGFALIGSGSRLGFALIGLRVRIRVALIGLRVRVRVCSDWLTGQD